MEKKLVDFTVSLDQVSHSIKHSIYVVDDSGSSTGALTRGDRWGGGGTRTPTLHFYVANFSLKKPITSREKLCVGGGGWERQCSVNTNGAFTDRDQDR